ncbi:MAG: hypothetical protein SGILL_007702 [Bacillariaceae sp.]
MFALNIQQVSVTAFLEESPHFDQRQQSSTRSQAALASTHSLPVAPSNRVSLRIPSRRASARYAKKDDKDSSDEDDDDSSPSFLNVFKRDSKEEEDSSKQTDKKTSSSRSSIPIVGRFFGKGDNQEDEEEEEEKSSRVRSVVGRYFSSRRERKDAEALREEVLQREEAKRLRIEEQKKKVAEARRNLQAATGAVVRENRQEVVKREVEKLRRIEAQKVVDLQRLERLEIARLERELRQQGIKPTEADKVLLGSSISRQSSSEQKPASSVKPKPKPKPKEKDDEKKTDDDKRDPSESSSRGGFGVVSVAQKFMAGLFEKEEEWIVVAPKTRIAPGELVPLTVAGIDLLLVASKDASKLHCIANACPHLGTPLEIGTLERRPIESSSSNNNNKLDGDVTTVPGTGSMPFFQEKDIAQMLKKDGCEDCIVCPLHKTAFALESGEVRGEWCPYPPVIGKLTGAIKTEANLPVFDVRTRGKNIEVRLNTPVVIESDEKDSKKK